MTMPSHPKPPAPEPPPPPAAPEKRGVRRALVGFLIVANLVVFGALGAVWWAANKVSSSVSTIPSSDLSLADLPADLQAPRTFLLVGSDSRENLDDFEHFGRVGGQRSDVMILFQVLPRDGKLQMVSIPRDLRIDFNGSVGRINATFAKGASNLVEAMTDEFGLPIHHYLQVEFGGFAGIVDAVGGIRITFPYPARDLTSGFEVDAGTQLLDGDQALAYARSRKYQEQRDGSWVSVDANDIGRTRRQQDVLLAILTQVDRPSSLGGFRDLVNALGEFVVTDSGFDAEEIIQVGWAMRGISGTDVESITLPVQGFSENGTSYVVRNEPEASSVIDAFRVGAPLAIDNDARIQVQNGNGVAGSAGIVADGLTAAGFDVVGTVDNPRSDYGTTQILCQASHWALASAIAEELGYGEVIIGRTPAKVEVVVIVGADAPSG